MKCVLAEYSVKEDKVDEVKVMIKKFIDGIRHHDSDVLSYKSFSYKEDQKKFIHMMIFADVEAETDHKKAPHTREFIEKLYPMCTKEPEFTLLDLIDSSLSITKL